MTQWLHRRKKPEPIEEPDDPKEPSDDGKEGQQDGETAETTVPEEKQQEGGKEDA